MRDSLTVRVREREEIERDSEDVGVIVYVVG